MIPRELRPGVLVLVDEDTVWRELLAQVRPQATEQASEPLSDAAYPGSNSLCTVRDLAVREDATGGPDTKH